MFKERLSTLEDLTTENLQMRLPKSSRILLNLTLLITTKLLAKDYREKYQAFDRMVKRECY